MRCHVALIVLTLFTAAAHAAPPTPGELKEFRRRLVGAARQNGDPRLSTAILVMEETGFLPDVFVAARAVAPDPAAVDEAKVLRVVSTWAPQEYPTNPFPQYNGPFAGARLLKAAPAVIAGVPSKKFVEAKLEIDWCLKRDPRYTAVTPTKFWVLIRLKDWTVAQHEHISQHMPDGAAPPWR